jgi:hypothetical protein
MKSRKRFARRDFLGLVGMGAVAGGLSCVGGVVGYLVFKQVSRAGSPTAAPANPSAPRPDRLKQIDRPPIVSRAEWGARDPDHSAANESGFYSLENVEGWREYEGDLREIYRTVVIHHSVLYEGDDLTTMQEIQKEHMELRRWADIGYHFGVGQGGQVFEGRALNVRGTHVEGFNTGSVGVVFLGNFQLIEPTPVQIDTGQHLIDWLALRLELTHLAGHRDFNDFTDCPGNNMLPYLAAFANSAGLMLGTGGYQPSPEQLITPTPGT